MENHGLADGHPELVEYAQANKDKPWFQVGQGFDDLAKSLAARTAGTSTGVVAPQSQGSNPDLVQAFRTELAEAREKGQYGMQTLRNLENKYVELGVSIEELNISNEDSINTRGYLYRSESPFN